MDDTTRALLAEIDRLARRLDGEMSLSAARLRTIRHQRGIIEGLRSELYHGGGLDEAYLTAERAWAVSEQGEDRRAA